MTLSRFAIATLLCMTASSTLTAQEAQKGEAPPSPARGILLSQIPSTPPPYADSAEGMRLQLANVMRTWWSGDKEKFSAQLEIFALPNPKSWLVQTLGAERGAALLPDYETSLDKFKSDLFLICGNWCNDAELTLKVENSDLPKPAEDTGKEAALPKPLLPVPVENFRFTLKLDARLADVEILSFVYLDGSFRVLGGTYPFWDEDLRRLRHPNSTLGQLGPNGSLIVSGTVQQARLLHSVPPQYPREAKKMHIQGTVRLHALIGKDGRIKDLKVIDGDPDLAQAAVSAVRQWIYQPTMSLGNPVEVDTTINVVFTLGPR